MSKKDYYALGDVLAGAWATATPREKGVVWSLTLLIADVFAKDSRHFNRARFYEYVLGTEDHFAAREQAEFASIPRSPGGAGGLSLPV